MPELQPNLSLLKGICIYRNLLEDSMVRSYMALLDGLASKAEWETILDHYGRFLAELVEITELGPGSIVDDPWRNHVLELILDDQNPFTRKAEYVPFREMSQGLMGLAKRDLRILQGVLYESLENVCLRVERRLKEQAGDFPEQTADFSEQAAEFPERAADFPRPDMASPCNVGGPFHTVGSCHSAAPSHIAGPFHITDPSHIVAPFHIHIAGSFHPLSSGAQDCSRYELKQALASASDWGECLDLLAEYARSNGCGMFGKYRAFRWVPEKLNARAHLLSISHPDPVKLDDLISYERQKGQVVANTRRFVEGYPANNVLLYGDRGTGKSSVVKALLHEFAGEGLRLIEVSREGFNDLPEIMALLSTRPQRFIIFIDDLSFEEYETEYKSLKAVMEGGLQAQPENVLIYATSNRKHLIKETFNDRAQLGAQGDLHPDDAQEEKISLADRFGLVVTFLRPDQNTYLEIVRGLAEKEGITLEQEELESMALKWEMLNNGRSGRTARQFILDLQGRINMGKEGI